MDLPQSIKSNDSASNATTYLKASPSPTESATAVQKKEIASINKINPILKAYYLLTSYMPRKLPMTTSQFNNLKYILQSVHKVPEHPEAWIALSGQITSNQANSIRKSHGALANACKRQTIINKLAHEQKMLVIKDLEDKLREATKRATDELHKEASKVSITESVRDLSIEEEPKDAIGSSLHVLK